MRYIAKRVLVSIALALIALATGSGPVQANLLDPTGTDVTSRFSHGITDSDADSSWIYLVDGNGHSGRVSVADGSLDPDWGVTTPSPFDTGWSREIAELCRYRGFTDVEVDSKGRVLEYGWMSTGTGTGVPSARQFLTRTKSNGLPDQSFASGGVQMPRIFNSSQSFTLPGRIGLDGKGRIYESVLSVVEPSRKRKPLTRFRVVRFLPNGKFDTSYGTEGSMTFAADRTATKKFRLIDMAVNENGRTVVLLNIFGKGSLIRTIDATGRPDRRFNKATRWVGLAGGKVKPISVDFDRSGDLTVAVAKRGTDAKVAVDRVKPDGSPRRSFGDDGRLTITDGWLRKNLGTRAPLIAKGTKLVVGSTVDSRRRTILTLSGEAGMVGAQNAFSIRVLPNGELDQGFGEGGFFLRLSPLYPKTDVLPIATLPSGAAIVSNGAGTGGAVAKRLISLYGLG